MERVTIVCESCQRLWSIGRSLTIYEQQALESRPCPRCGAYTLCCHEPEALVGAGERSGDRSVLWSSFAA
jgi:hypothetical protein